MSDGRVKLWRWQKKSVPLTSGTIDHAMTKYACRFPNYLPSIRELVDRLRLSDDKFIWCSDSRQDWHGNDRTLYELSVPQKAILAWINPTAWALLIDPGGPAPCPRKVYDRLEQQGRSQGRDLKIARDERSKWYKSLSREELWAQLFRQECAGDERDAIVALPLCDHWIIHPR